MPNKPYEKLNPLDRALREACPVGIRDEADCTITLRCGFELFNTRPYHNYETWSQGYTVTGRGVVVSREDLDDAINEWCRLVKAKPNV